LMASRRMFPSIGPGLRALRRSANGNYYVLASPAVGLAIFDAKGKEISIIGAPPPAAVANKAGRSAIAFGEDCDVDAQGNIYVADTGYNLVNEFAPDGKQLRSFPVSSLLSLAVLPGGEVAVSTRDQVHHVTVYGADGKVSREFGEDESLSSRADIDRYLNVGRVASDPQGRIYYGFTYMPEPLVRQYDRYGNATQDFVFTGVDAYPEASTTRKAIERLEVKGEPPVFHAILTSFGVDPVSGDIWMGFASRRYSHSCRGRAASDWWRSTWRLRVSPPRSKTLKIYLSFPQPQLHCFSAVRSKMFFSFFKFLCFRGILGPLAHFPCLWKSCECHVNVGTGLGALFACSAADSARESIQF
jgi:hypothetical protein